jgi:Fe-S-cluster containining protein
MSENKNLSVLENQPESLSNLQGQVISFSIEAAGKNIPFAINVMNDQATLSDIVQPARKLSNEVVLAHQEQIEQKGQKVPCKKGCCSCCSSLIPMSVPEVFRMREDFMEMPNEKSSVLLRNCIQSAQQILKKSRNRACLKDFAEKGKDKTNQISDWYGELGIVCPFLSGGICSIYEERPLACREHIVTEISTSCKKDSKSKPKVVPMQVSVLEALGQLASELEGTEVDAIILPFSLAWAQDNPQRAQRKWPAEEMVQRFAKILQYKAQNSKKDNL